MRTECLDYRQLPGQNPLFVDYLYQYDRVSDLYGRPVHLELEQLKKRAANVASRTLSHGRGDLVDFLRKFNQRIGASQRTFDNLEKLKSESTVAVVTGQQPGLFGGPAFTAYKAITAIRLAQILEGEGYSTVPIFWLASDNSDFGEVESTCLLDATGELLELRHPDTRRDPAEMVGGLALSKVQGCFETLKERPPKGEFAQDLLALLDKSYPPTSTFGEALGSWLARLFEADGLILFDPLDPRYRRSAKPVFQIAIERGRQIVQALEQRSQQLTSRGFSPQVRFDQRSTLIYWAEGEKRYRLELDGASDQAGAGSPIRMERQECLARLEQSPERFTPNVLLRPIVQDFLLPTVAYVGGPSEVAYFSQVNAISPFWDQETAVFPRLGVTVADKKSQRIMARYGIQPANLFGLEPEELAQEILKQKDSGNIIGRLERLQGHLREELEELRIDLEEVDPSVAGMVEGVGKKVFYQTDKIQTRFLSNKRRRDETLVQNVSYLYARLYPRRQLQERLIGFNQFLSEEGLEFTRRLIEVTDPFCLSHQIVYL